MLRDADAALAERDPALPGLRTVLDESALAAVLGADPARLRVRYLRYKPGTSMLACCEFAGGDDGSAEFGYAAAYGPAGMGKLGKHAAVSAGGWTPVVDPALQLVVAPAEADRQLPGIRAVAARRSAKLLRDTTVQVGPLRYKPHRRWVAVASREDVPVAVVRVQRPAAAVALATAHRVLTDAGVRVARLDKVDARRGLVITRWVPGTTLEELGATAATGGLVGQALARLHRVSAWPGLPEREPRREATAAVRAVRAIAPDLAPRARAIAVEALARLSGSTPAVVVHGDLSPDQVVLGSARLRLLDLERVARADPAVDLASWIAAAPAGNGADGADAVLEGYRRAGGFEVESRLAPYTALALLGRAAVPFRWREPDWPIRSAALLDRAAKQLEAR